MLSAFLYSFFLASKPAEKLARANQLRRPFCCAGLKRSFILKVCKYEGRSTLVMNNIRGNPGVIMPDPVADSVYSIDTWVSGVSRQPLDMCCIRKTMEDDQN